MDRPDPQAGAGTTVAEARLLVAAAISFIEDVARTWHLTRYAGVGDEMTAIAMSILTVEPITTGRGTVPPSAN